MRLPRLLALLVVQSAAVAPVEVPGYVLYADWSCFTDAGETEDELVSGTTECAATCDRLTITNCVGWWMHGRTRGDGLYFCRYYRGTWGEKGSPYEGNDCYLRVGLPGRPVPPVAAKLRSDRSRAIRLLGLRSVVRHTRHELNRAYRRMALKWHPDRHKESQREEATMRFREVRSAFELLSESCISPSQVSAGKGGS
mmetsp:Transcript_61111/g.117771  ORF Transcript_61111/g.117771 Transcript_61111/m.117771 type:complete len:197 (-) Transcript_61111:71-661(-)